MTINEIPKSANIPSIAVPAGTVVLSLAEYQSLLEKAYGLSAMISESVTSSPPPSEVHRDAVQIAGHRETIIAYLGGQTKPVNMRQIVEGTGITHRIVASDVYELRQTRRIIKIGGKRDAVYMLKNK